MPAEHEPAPPRVRRGPPWFVVLIAVVVVGLFATCAVVIRGEDVAATAPNEWTYLGRPPTSEGGAYVYTRCDGTTRLYLTVGPDGNPAGPVSTVDTLHGSGCDR